MKKNTILLIASIIGTVCAVICIFAMTKITKSSVIPIVAAIAGTVFAWCGWGLNKKIFALVAGVLYIVAIVALPSMGIIMFNMVQMILCFIAYGTWKKEA